mmetsp:Transcript_23332/g.57422  ORF Transcript_23332/g.57422 Transcript_23332/m.57422 type:complete len:595 (-) Transcript_23332:31-1815(-)
MAEHVQESLDRMVAPLRDLMDRQIFSETEIKAIVERRRESEYLLRRVAARKADFLRYIQAEQDLERLRQLRTKQRKRDHLKSQIPDEHSQKQHIGDVHIVQHLHLLFVRAIRKFRSDLSLHLLHADFCKQMKSYSRLGKVYSEALQIFPRQSGLWIEAASNEFFGPNRSIRNARILLQRGIRFNKTSEDIWCQMFSLEMHYAQTLRGRKQILLGAKITEEIAESASYKIAEVIYKNAVKAVSDSIPFRLRLLDICRKFPDTERLMETIQEQLETDFGGQPEAWIARALFEAEKDLKVYGSESDDEEEEKPEHPSKKQRKNDAAVAVLEKAIDALPNDRMHLQAFEFARKYKEELEEKGDSVIQVQEFLDLLEKRISGHLSSELALEYADYLLESSKVTEALASLENFCMSKKPVDSSPWIQWAGLSSSPKTVLSRATKCVPMSSACEHLKILLQLFGCQLSAKEDNFILFQTFQRLLLLSPSSQSLFVEDLGACQSFGLQSIAEACVKYLEHAATIGLPAVRKVYSAVLFNSSVEVNDINMNELQNFVERSAALESKDKVRRRRIYERALEMFEGTDLEHTMRKLRESNAAKFY